MKKILKASIRPIFIGFSFYLFILLGHNTKLISNDASRTWSTIFAGAIFIYLIVYAAIHNKKQFGISAFGFCIAHIVFSIGVPIFMIVNQVLFTDQNINEPRSLLEKEKIELISNPSQCHEIKYGIFFNGIDTIIRYSKNNKDYELVKVMGLDDKLNSIKWLDSCSYVRLINKSSISEYVRLGNIKDGDHQMYERPAITHKMENENIKTFTELKN